MNPLNKLQQQGYLTKQKKLVLEVLNHTPQTVAQIQAKLIKQKAQINLVTIYRVLEAFTQLHITHKTQFQDNVNRYELADSGHHHHLVCENCGTIADIKLDQENFIKTAEQQSHFKIHHHLLEFFGLCHHCQKLK